MFFSPKLYLRDRFIGSALMITVVLQGVMWWYVLAHVQGANEQFFLHYNSIFGVDLVGEWWKILYLPAAGLGIVFVNYTVSFGLFATERPLARFLAIATPIIETFLLLILIFIIGLNS